MVRFSSSLFNYLSILLVGRTNELLFYSFTLHLLSLASGNPFKLTSGPLTCPQHFWGALLSQLKFQNQSFLQGTLIHFSEEQYLDSKVWVERLVF